MSAKFLRQSGGKHDRTTGLLCSQQSLTESTYSRSSFEDHNLSNIYLRKADPSSPPSPSQITLQKSSHHLEIHRLRLVSTVTSRNHNPDHSSKRLQMYTIVQVCICGAVAVRESVDGIHVSCHQSQSFSIAGSPKPAASDTHQPILTTFGLPNVHHHAFNNLTGPVLSHSGCLVYAHGPFQNVSLGYIPDHRFDQQHPDIKIARSRFRLVTRLTAFRPLDTVDVWKIIEQAVLTLSLSPVHKASIPLISA